MKYEMYELYKITRAILEKLESCRAKDHSHELMIKSWKSTIESFDSLGRGYEERYEKEKENAVV